MMKKKSGKGQLINPEVGNLRAHYDIAIRRNVNNLENMRKDILAIYFHKIPIDGNPQHGLCPKCNHCIS